MSCVIAYMLTWPTYGSWVPGDCRGWVKNGKPYSANPSLENNNRQEMKADTVILTKEQRLLASQSIVSQASKLEQKIFALTVQSTHVHIVAENIDQTIGRVVSYYKNAVRLNLQDNGFDGKLWASGFDKRYCMNIEQLKVRIDYVRKHETMES